MKDEGGSLVNLALHPRSSRTHGHTGEMLLLDATTTQRLPPSHLRMAIRDCLDGHAHCQPFVKPNLADKSLEVIQGRLWREDLEDVAAAYDSTMLLGVGRALEGHDYGEPAGCKGRLAERMAELRRPLPYRNRKGRTIAEIAVSVGMPRETMAALMEHHGYLETVPYGRNQSRRLVTDKAFDAEYGHNVDSSKKRVAYLEGSNRAAVFPVFYPEIVSALLWTLDYEGIRDKAVSISNKRERLLWVLRDHGYLPDAEVARLTGYSVRGVEKARQKALEEKADGASAVPMAA